MRYIDYGNSEVINRFSLVQLPEELVNFTQLCERYVVDDMELVDRDKSSELYVKVVNPGRSVLVCYWAFQTLTVLKETP